MAHNSRAIAVWHNGDVPVEIDFNTLDQNGFTAINGDDGGTWAPAAKVEIGGLGLSARHVYGLIVVGANANTSYALSAARLIYLDNTITADRTYTLSATGAVDGDVMEIVALPSFSTARTLTVNDNLGAAIARIGRSFTVGTSRSAKFVYLGAQWRLLSSERNSIAVVDAGGVGSIASGALSATVITDIPGYTASLTCVAGDVLIVNMALAVTWDNTQSGTIYASVVDGGVTTNVASATYHIYDASNTARMFSYCVTYVVTNSGTVTWKGRYVNAAGGYTLSLGGAGQIASITLLQLRP